jgi:hypothetical protein
MCLIESLAGTGEGVSLGMNEALDFKDELNVAAAVKALAGSTFVGLELGKLRLPEAEDIRLEVEDSGNVANFEVEAVGDCRSGIEGACVSELGSHRENAEATAIEAEASVYAKYRPWIAPGSVQSGRNCGRGAWIYNRLWKRQLSAISYQLGVVDSALVVQSWRIPGFGRARL